jgi:predicted negative regulator of RcsB-dependent stress response
MAYDLEEQEQIANFKAFWNRFGNLITWVLIIALGGYAAYNFWNTHQRGKSAEASALYSELADMAQAPTKDLAKIQRVSTDIETKFGGTAYGQMAALTAAKAAFDANGNDEYKAVARLRMSGVLLDEKAYDKALAILNGEFPPQFAAEVADRKGDVLVAQNKLPDARTAYQAALDKMDKKHPGRQIVQVKLDAIGGAPAGVATKAAA